MMALPSTQWCAPDKTPRGRAEMTFLKSASSCCLAIGSAAAVGLVRLVSSIQHHQQLSLLHCYCTNLPFMQHYCALPAPAPSQLHICGSVSHLVQPLGQEVRQALSRTALRAKSALSWAVVMTTRGRGVILSCRLGGSDRPNHCLLLVYRWGATRSSSSDSATITFLSPRSTSTCSPTILVRLYYFKINITCSRTILK